MMKDARKLCDQIARLVHALEDPDPAIRRDAARTLGDIGELVAGAVPGLIACLSVSDDAERVRSRAAAALRKISLADASGALPALNQLLADPDAHTRCDAAWALTRIRGSAHPARQVVECTADPDPNVRFHAALALGDIGEVSDSVIPTLEHLLEDPDDYVRLSAARSMAALGRTTQAMAVLNGLLNHEDPVIRESAIAVLPLLRGEEP